MLTVQKRRVLKSLSLIAVLIFVFSFAYLAAKYFFRSEEDQSKGNEGKKSSTVSSTDLISEVPIPQFEFVSDIPQYQISVGSVNTVLLDKMLTEVKYSTTWNKFRLLVDVKEFSPKKVVFKFADINKLNPQEKDSLFDKTETSGGEILGGVNSYFEERDSIMVYTIYRNIAVYEDFSEAYLSHIWTRDVLRLLYRLSVKSNFGHANEEELSRLTERILGDRKEALLFRIEKKVSYRKGYLEAFAKIVQESLGLLEIPTVYAQTCSSTYTCGRWTNIGDCPGQPDYYDSQCISLGDLCGPDANGDGFRDTTCSFTQECRDCGIISICGERACNQANQSACTTLDTCNDCNVSQCTWTPGPGPTSTPRPTNTPAPGNCWCGDCAAGTCALRSILVCNASYGGCGGCTNCAVATPTPTRAVATASPRPTNTPTPDPCRLSAACTYLESRQTAINNYCNSVSSCTGGTWSNPARCYGGNSGSGCQWQSYWMSGFGGFCQTPWCECLCIANTPTPTRTPTPTPTRTPTPAPVPSCTLTLSWAPPVPPGNTINQGSSGTINASVSFSNGTVDRVNFSSSNTSVATVSPFSDPSSPYSTTVTGVGAGSSTIAASAYMGGVIRCSNSLAMTVRATSTPTIGPTNTPGGPTNTPTTRPSNTPVPPTNTPTTRPSNTPTPPPGLNCTVVLTPSTPSGGVPGLTSFLATVTDVVGGTVSRVNFNSSNISVATLTSSSKSSVPYTTTATHLAGGTTTVSAQVIMNSGISEVAVCSDSSILTITAPPPPTNTPGGPTNTPGAPTNTPRPTAVPPTATPTPGICSQPRPRDPPDWGCNRETGNWWINWQWPRVWDADGGRFVSEYQLQVDNEPSFSAPYVYNSWWQSSAFFQCSDGMCNYTTWGLTSNRTYYGRVRTRGVCTTSNWGYTGGLWNSCAWCTFNLLPANTVIELMTTDQLWATNIDKPTNIAIDRVNFSSSNTSIASVNPGSDGSSPYRTDVYGEGVSPPDATINASMVMEGRPICDDSSQVSVINPPPWFQVENGDVLSGGDVISQIAGGCPLNSPPCDPYLVKNTSGTPEEAAGIPSAGRGGNVSWGAGNGPSRPGWVVEGSDYGGDTYTYQFFRDKIPTSVSLASLGPTVTESNLLSGGTEYPSGSGYYYYQYSNPSDLTLTDGDASLNIGSRKVVVFVQGGSVKIDKNINLTDGTGLLLLITDGNITVDESVTEMEGLYFAQRDFLTTDVQGSDLTLLLRGSVVSQGTLVMDRDLPNNAITPAETFKFAPDLLMNFPASLGERHARFRELAP